MSIIKIGVYSDSMKCLQGELDKGACHMKMANLLILEDDRENQALLRRMVMNSPFKERLRVDAVSNAASLKAFIDSGRKIDILMIDIALGSNSPNGIEVVRHLFPAGCGTQVIYVSGYVEFCTPVYQTEHAYFLLKPVKQRELDAALRKSLTRLNASESKPIALQHGSSVTLVPAAEIEYIESDRRKVRVHTTTGKVIEIYATLSEMMDMLPDDFAQCHKSFIVNMALIDELSASAIRMRSGEEVPISQRQRKAVRQTFFHYVGLGE